MLIIVIIFLKPYILTPRCQDNHRYYLKTVIQKKKNILFDILLQYSILMFFYRVIWMTYKNIEIFAENLFKMQNDKLKLRAI